MCVRNMFIVPYQNTKLIRDEVLILVVFIMVAIDVLILLIYTGIIYCVASVPVTSLLSACNIYCSSGRLSRRFGSAEGEKQGEDAKS